MVFVLSNAIAIPTMFKLSIEKARYVYIAVMIAMTFVIIGGIKILEMTGVSLEALNELPIVFPVIILPVMMIVGVAVSYQIAVTFAKKREW